MFAAGITRALIGQFEALISRNVPGPITGLEKQSKNPYIKQLINKRSVLAGKSQSSTLSYWPHDRSVNTQGVGLRFPVKDFALG